MIFAALQSYKIINILILGKCCLVYSGKNVLLQHKAVVPPCQSI